MCRALGKWIVCLRWSCVKNRLLQTFQRSLKTLIGKSNNNLLSDSTISSKHVLYHSLGLFWEHSILLARWIKPKWLQCKKNTFLESCNILDVLCQFFAFAVENSILFSLIKQCFFSQLIHIRDCTEIAHSLHSFHSFTHSLVEWVSIETWEVFIYHLAYTISKIKHFSGIP